MQYTPRRLRLEKEKKKNVYKGKALRILAAILIGALMWFVISQAYNLALIRIAKTFPAEEGSLEKSVKIQAVLVRHEWLFTCPLSGKLRVIAKEGERVPEGSLLAVVTGEGSSVSTEMPVQNIYAKKTGIVSYKLDGLENVLTPSTIASLKEESVYEQAKIANSIVAANQDIIPSGTAFVKIVNNLKPIVLDFSLAKEVLEEAPKEGDTFLFRIPLEKEQWKATVVNVSKNPLNYRIIAETSDWPQQFLNSRFVELDCIINIFKGLIVPSSAISEKEGVKGVYKIDTNRYRFVPVEIIGQVGELAVVSGVEAGDEVLVDSSHAK